MSQENIDVVRRNQEAWNRRDLRAWLASFRSDAEIDWSRARGPLKGVYRGRGERETLWNEFFFTFEEAQIKTPQGFTDAGSEVVVSNTTHFRGREGIEVSASSTWVQSRTGRSLAFGCSRSETRPSKPPGFPSRRCRRRTSTWCGAIRKRGTGAT